MLIKSKRRSLPTSGYAHQAVVQAGASQGSVPPVVSPLLGDTPTQVGIVPVVLTTLLMFALGAGLLALAARRSRRWVRAVLSQPP
jgi:hypothetical protein